MDIIDNLPGISILLLFLLILFLLIFLQSFNLDIKYFQRWTNIFYFLKEYFYSCDSFHLTRNKERICMSDSLNKFSLSVFCGKILGMSYDQEGYTGSPYK